MERCFKENPGSRLTPTCSIQELGEGAFGKVYKGELTGFLGGMSALVAIKTLKPGKNCNILSILFSLPKGGIRLPILLSACYR